MIDATKELNKFKGCLFGGAVGDALGYSVEFLSYNEIVAKYGKDGIISYDLANGKALISDDTQMTLFTANGLLFGITREHCRGIMGEPYVYCIGAYHDWYRGQTNNYDKEEYQYTWLFNIKELRENRFPGTTCLNALSAGINSNGTIDHPINNSKGCGGVMRVAPIGLYLNWINNNQKEIDYNGAKAAAITHGHELGYIPAAMLVHIISKINYDKYTILDAVNDSIKAIKEEFPNAQHLQDLIDLVKRAIDYSTKNINDVDAIHQLGEGWVAEETLAIAIYCALKYSNDFKKGIIAAVNHDGDSDSTGAVCGNILGCYLGFDAIPSEYIKNLELKEIINEIATDLYNDCQISEYKMDDPIWISKYIENDYKM